MQLLGTLYNIYINHHHNNHPHHQQPTFQHQHHHQHINKKSRIRETKHLSTDADSSTDEKRKKSSKTQKLKNVQKYGKISNTPFDQRSLIHRKAWFPPCFVGQRIPQNPIFLKNRKNHRKRKNSKTSRNMPKLAVSNPSGSVLSGWTKNTQKPNFFEKRKKSSKTEKIIQNAKTQKRLEISQNQRYAL